MRVEARGRGPDLLVYRRRRDQAKRKGPVVSITEERDVKGRDEVVASEDMVC